jgi:hypothetical protein
MSIPELIIVKDFNSSGYYLIIKEKIVSEELSNCETSSIAVYKRCLNKKYRDNSKKYSFYSFLLEGKKCYINLPGSDKIASYDTIDNKDIINELQKMYRHAIIENELKQKIKQSFNGVLDQYSEYTRVTILSDRPKTDALARINTSNFNPKEKLPFRYRNK